LACAEPRWRRSPRAASRLVEPDPIADRDVASVGDDDVIEQLKKLGELKEAGVLDEAEFQTAKAKLLATM